MVGKRNKVRRLGEDEGNRKDRKQNSTQLLVLQGACGDESKGALTVHMLRMFYLWQQLNSSSLLRLSSQ